MRKLQTNVADAVEGRYAFTVLITGSPDGLETAEEIGQHERWISDSAALGIMTTSFRGVCDVKTCEQLATTCVWRILRGGQVNVELILKWSWKGGRPVLPSD